MTRFTFRLATVALLLVSGLATATPPAKGEYPFPLPPDRAIAAVEKLGQATGTKLTLTDAERKLFEDARDGQLDTHSFADACLIASGVTDPAKRKEYLAKLDVIEADARKAVADAKTPAEKGDRLLKFLHDGPMKGGYASKQTDLHTVLDGGTFNCVSSAVLYNVIGRRLGLDLVAVEVPQHVFSALRDGDRRTDVETTTARGFDPKGEKTPKGTPPADRYAGKRREVGELGLAAIIAYNHGVGLADEKKHGAALLTTFRALSLDPVGPGAATNARAALVNWAGDLAKAGKFEESLAVIATGLEIAPKDSALLNNHKVVWQEFADERMKAGKDEESLAVLRRAAKAIPTADFETRQADLYTRPAQELIDEGKWEAALAAYTAGLGKVDPKAKAKLKDARVGLFLDWSNTFTDKGEFEKALVILRQGAAIEPKDGRIRNNTAATYDAWANTYMEKKDWSSAIGIYRKGLAHLPDNGHLKNNLSYCQQEAKR